MSRGLGLTSIPPAGVAASNTTRYAALAAGAVGILAGMIRFGPTSRGVVTAALLGALGVLAGIAFRHHVIPNLVVLPAAAVVLALRLALFSDHTLEWVLAALISCAALLALSALRRDTLDVGDAKVGLLPGAGLGTEV